MDAIGYQARQRLALRTEAARRLKAAQNSEAPPRSGPDEIAAVMTRRTEIQAMREMRERGILPSRYEMPSMHERIIGRNTNSAFPPSPDARAAGRPVARIVMDGWRMNEPQPLGSGFLIGPSLLMTNNHVIGSATEAVGYGAHFLFEETELGTSRGVMFELDPGMFFLKSAPLDYTIIGVRARADVHFNPGQNQDLDELGAIRLIETPEKILEGDCVRVIQHPRGGPKVYAFQEGVLMKLLDLFMQYDSDTEPGSSGSPVFNQDWELVSLHHCSVPETNEDDQLIADDGSVWTTDMGEDRIRFIGNQGVRISSIVRDLHENPPQEPSQRRIWRSLLDDTRDPLATFQMRPVSPAPPQLERVPLGPGPLISAVNLSWRPQKVMPVSSTGCRLFPVGSKVKVGRRDDMDVVLSDARASREHVVIEIEGDGVMVEDLGSANGTFLHGSRIKRALWTPGHKLKVGDHLFEIEPIESVAALTGRAKEARAAEPASVPARRVTVKLVNGNIVEGADTVVTVGIFAQGDPTDGGVAREIDRLSGGAFGRLLRAELFGTGVGQVSFLPLAGESQWRQPALVAGLGYIDDFDADVLVQVAENLARFTSAAGLSSFATVPIGVTINLDARDCLKAMLRGAAKALHDQPAGEPIRSFSIHEMMPGRWETLAGELVRLHEEGFFAMIGLDVDVDPTVR